MRRPYRTTPATDHQRHPVTSVLVLGARSIRRAYLPKIIELPGSSCARSRDARCRGREGPVSSQLGYIVWLRSFLSDVIEINSLLEMI